VVVNGREGPPRATDTPARTLPAVNKIPCRFMRLMRAAHANVAHLAKVLYTEVETHANSGYRKKRAGGE
jgi:hypothetical protein